MNDDDRGVLDKVSKLTDEEHELWRCESGGGATDADKARLKAIEVELDQCWDLLRQRRAHREFGQDPDTAQVRDSSTVEGYKQ
jgi:Protein of unknown function (DUF2630)